MTKQILETMIEAVEAEFECHEISAAEVVESDLMADIHELNIVIDDLWMDSKSIAAAIVRRTEKRILLNELMGWSL